jgi:DNA polymerase III subunit alpha
LTNIPFEGDEAIEAFKLLSSGEVSGVFQVESQGMRRVLTEMRPSKFEHIVATISLYRPGPIGVYSLFIRRMHGEEEVEYKHPALEPILAETYGIIVYQEQIIQIAEPVGRLHPRRSGPGAPRHQQEEEGKDAIEHHEDLHQGLARQKRDSRHEPADAIY